MAEFCLDCLNNIFKERKPLKEKDVVMDMDLCEECGEWKPCVITIKKKHWRKRFSLRRKTRY